jgi:Sigma-70, region 4
VRAAIASLPWRERKVVGLYYYNEATMKDIGAEIGVNESRVSQLHARAVQRLRAALGPETDPKSAAKIMTEALAAFRQKPKMLKAQLATVTAMPARAAAGARMPAAPAWTRMPVAMAAEKPARPRSRSKSA